MRKHIAAVGLLLTVSVAAPTSAAALDNFFVSKQNPTLTLAVDRRFHALPPVRTPLENTVLAERRIFVDGRKGEPVKSLVIIQAEHVLPKRDFRYRFPAKPPHRFGAQTYGLMTFAYDEAAEEAKNPHNELAATRAALRAHGYKPAKLYRVARLARVANSTGTHEIIIFLFENIDGEPARGPENLDGGGWALKPAEKDAVVKRLEAAVRVVKG